MWEYLVVVLESGIFISGSKHGETINDMGKQQWELVGLITMGDTLHAYFKRPYRPKIDFSALGEGLFDE